MQAVDSDGSVMYVKDHLVGVTGNVNRIGSGSGLRGGSSRAILSVSSFYKVDTAQLSFIESSTIGWLILQGWMRVIWEDQNT